MPSTKLHPIQIKMVSDRLLGITSNITHDELVNHVVKYLNDPNKFQFEQRAMLDRLKNDFSLNLSLETHGVVDSQAIISGANRRSHANHSSREALKNGDVTMGIDRGFDTLREESNIQRKRNPQIAGQLADLVITAHKRRLIARNVVRIGFSHKVLDYYLEKIHKRGFDDVEVKKEFDEGLPELVIPKDDVLFVLEVSGKQPTKEQVLYVQIHDLMYDSTNPSLTRRERIAIIDRALATYNAETLPELVAGFRAETYEQQARDLLALVQAA